MLPVPIDIACQTVLLPIDITPLRISLFTVIATQTIPLLFTHQVLLIILVLCDQFFGHPSRFSTTSMKIPGLES